MTRSNAPTTPKKTEKTQRNEEPKKEPTPKPEATRVETEIQGHEEQAPDVPVPPEFDGPNRPRRHGTRVFPGGVVIRNLPDGSQIITMPDGMRVMVTKDGKRTILNPPRPRRRAFRRQRHRLRMSSHKKAQNAQKRKCFSKEVYVLRLVFASFVVFLMRRELK